MDLTTTIPYRVIEYNGKPLFRPDVIRSHLAAFSLPERIEPLRESDLPAQASHDFR